MEIEAPSRITFGGIATGLDMEALLEGLLAVERLPLQRLESQRDEIRDEQALFRELNTLVLAVQMASEKIDNLADGTVLPSSSEEFLSYQAASSDESSLVATATSSAAPGTYDVRISALASVGRDISNRFDDTVTNFGVDGDTFTVTYGTGPTPGSIDIDIPVGGISLAELRSQINNSVDNDGSIRAETIFDGTGYRLVVSGTQTGAENDIAVSTTLSAPGPLAFIETTTDATDANFEVLGVAMTRSSNQISDALPGVALDLRGVHDPLSPTGVTVTVSRDDDTIAEGLQELVDAVNALREFSLKQSRFDDETGQAGLLSGEPLVRSVESMVSNAIYDLYDFGDGSAYESLWSVGLRTGEDGQLSLEREVLQSALDDNTLGVRKLLAGEGAGEGEIKGVASRLSVQLETIVRTGDGALFSREQSYDRRIRLLEDNIARFEERLASREQTLIQRFAALETTVSRLQGQSSFLAGIGGSGG